MITQRLKALGITLQTPATPIANYTPFVRSGNLLFISGQVSLAESGAVIAGKAGETATLAEAQNAAKRCAIAILQQINAAGYLDKTVRIVKLTGFVNATPAFTDIPQVINGASDLFVAVFENKGVHARSSVGVASLPRGALVEIEAIVEITS